MVDSEMQSRKTSSPKLVKGEEKDTSSRDLQPIKAMVPIEVTDVGMCICFN